MRNNQPVTGREVDVANSQAIVSQTDLDGNITYVNPYLIDISGYSEEELLGAPQNILRHPDMPAVAFKGLWDTMATGAKWHGYVKNLRKDGRYYWVYATVVTNIRDGKVVGYTSVRRKPSRTRVLEADALYKTLR